MEEHVQRELGENRPIGHRENSEATENSSDMSRAGRRQFQMHANKTTQSVAHHLGYRVHVESPVNTEIS